MKVKDEYIIEVRTCKIDSEATKLLSEGWTLLESGVSKLDGVEQPSVSWFQVCRIPRREKKYMSDV